VYVVGLDRYGRTLGFVEVAGLDVNGAMVRDGLAWRYRFTQDAALDQFQSEARAARRGLWQDDKPIAPWDWRAKSTANRGAKVEAAETAEGPEPSLSHWLNTSTGVRHNASCKNFKNTKAGRVCAAAEGKACGIFGG
jgi:micrococcal nuclease